MAISLLPAIDKDRVKRKSSATQYLSAPLAVITEDGQTLPISFDFIDYVMADCVVSHKTALVGDDQSYNYPIGTCGGVHSDLQCGIGLDYSIADTTLEGEEDNRLNIMMSEDDDSLERKSSISQYSTSPLHVIVGGVTMPLSFDYIDYVMCDCVVSHKVKLAGEDNLGYDYPVHTCRYTTDTYAVVDLNGHVIEQKLPAWAGEGMYRKVLDGKAFVNADNVSLGTRQVEELTVGLDYVVSKQTLEAEE